MADYPNHRYGRERNQGGYSGYGSDINIVSGSNTNDVSGVTCVYPSIVVLVCVSNSIRFLFTSHVPFPQKLHGLNFNLALYTDQCRLAFVYFYFTM